MVVHQGIEKTVVRGVANESLRKIMLAAIAHDITISAKWIPGDSNGLADALSRFQAAAIHRCRKPDGLLTTAYKLQR
jgi:hypothetical protein